MTNNLPVVRYRGELLAYPVRDPQPWRLPLAMKHLVLAMKPVFDRMNDAVKLLGSALNRWAETVAPAIQRLMEQFESLNATEVRGEEEWESYDAYRWRPGAADALMLELKALE